MLLVWYPGTAMAVDNPVVNFSTNGVMRNSRVFELGIVVALTVAVVVVAALWGTSSTSPELVSVAEVESAAETPSGVPPVVGSDVATSDSSVGLDSATVAVQGSAEDQASSAVSAVIEGPAGGSEIPAQSGIVPGRPDPIGPDLPRSFERYQVQRGESLFVIAAARGVTMADLLQWNWHLQEDSTLIRGEWIWIPQWDVQVVADEPLAVDDGSRGRGGG